MSVNRWQLNKSNYEASIFSSRIDILNKSDYDLLHDIETLIRIAKNKPCITEKLLQKNWRTNKFELEVHNYK